MADLPTTPDEAVAFADAHLDWTLDRWEGSLDPVWRAQGQMMRTLVTLAAGAFVVTLSLVQLLAQATPPRVIAWRWLLPAAWALFCVTIVTGTLTHGWEAAARAMRLRFEGNRNKMRQAVRAIPIGVSDYADRFDKALEAVLGKAAEEPNRAFRVYVKLSGAASYSFAAGTLVLLVFAIRNLPF